MGLVNFVKILIKTQWTSLAISVAMQLLLVDHFILRKNSNQYPTSYGADTTYD